MAKLRQANILIGQGKKIPEVCTEIDVSEKYLLPLEAEIRRDEPFRALQNEKTRP